MIRLTLALCLLFYGCQTDVTREAAIVKDYAERYEPQIRKVDLEDVGEVRAPPGQFSDVPDAKTLAAVEKLASANSRAHEKYILLIFLRHHRANVEIAHQSYALQDLREKGFANPLVKELCRLIDCKPPDTEPMFSGVEYSWVKRHREFQQYEPIRVEMKRIEAVEKQIEENLKESLKRKGTSHNRTQRMRNIAALSRSGFVRAADAGR